MVFFSLIDWRLFTYIAISLYFFTVSQTAPHLFYSLNPNLARLILFLKIKKIDHSNNRDQIPIVKSDNNITRPSQVHQSLILILIKLMLITI